MDAADKPRDDACGHEVVGILEMEISRGTVGLDIDAGALGGQEFRYDIIIRTHDIETQLEFLHEPDEMGMFIRGVWMGFPIPGEMAAAEAAFIVLDFQGVDEGVDRAGGPSGL